MFFYPNAQARRRSEHDPDKGDAEIINFDPTVAKYRNKPIDPKRKAKKTFTSEKLSWIDYLRKDHRQELTARMVGICIAQHVNEGTKSTFISDRLIADELGISLRSVWASRQALRDGEWIAWCKPKPRGPNHTRLVLTEKNKNAVDDQQICLKDRRDFDAGQTRTRRSRS